MVKKYSLFLFMFLILVLSTQFIFAEEIETDPGFAGIEFEKLIAFINGILATILAVIIFIAYKRDKRSRLLFVGIAFTLFALRSFLVGYELFFPEINGIDPLTTILDFFVIISFFYGVIKKN